MFTIAYVEIPPSAALESARADLRAAARNASANAQSDPDASIGLRRALAMYERARGLFTQFLDRSASPSAQAAAKTDIDDCTKLMKQIEAFLAP